MVVAAPAFQQQGSYFAALNYTLAPEQSLTGIVEEVRRAIAWLYRNADDWGFDREKIFVSGHSAGAHLAMMLLAADWAEFDVPHDVIKGACAVSGIFDLEPVRLTYVNDAVGMSADEARCNSPVLKEMDIRCPVIFAYGDNETNEFKRQSDEYGTKLRNNDVPVTLRQIEGRNHFDVILDLADTDSWLAQQVFGQMRID
jgi:arylformamidase